MTRLACLALWALCVLALHVQRAKAQVQETWLVAVGNNSGARSETTLLYAERDARELSEALRVVGGVSGRRTTLLLGENADNVRRGLIDVNAEIRAHTREGKPTMLIVFYSGHADADALHLDGTQLKYDELRKMVEGSPASMRLLVVDSCRSGSVTRVKGVKPSEPFAIELEDQTAAEGMAIITSSAAGESSQESDALQGSFFSHHLVNALRGAADRDADGRVTLSEAYAYAYAQTLRSSGRTITLQHPTYSYDVKGRGHVVLSRPGDASVRAGHLRLAHSASYLITQEGKDRPFVAEISPDADRVRVALPEGSYLVQQRLPDQYREYQVTLARGAEVELERTPYHTVKYDQYVRSRGGSEHVHGLSAIAGARGQTVPGEGVTPQLALGYTLDVPWSTFGVRVRGSRAPSNGADGLTSGHHDEYALGLTFQRVFDTRVVSLGLGVLVEGVLHHQVRTGEVQSLERNSFGFGFGALASLERQLFAGAALRLEGGPMTNLFRQAQVHDGQEAGDELASILTWWAAGGLVWRL